MVQVQNLGKRGSPYQELSAPVARLRGHLARRAPPCSRVVLCKATANRTAKGTAVKSLGVARHERKCTLLCLFQGGWGASPLSVLWLTTRGESRTTVDIFGARLRQHAHESPLHFTPSAFVGSDGSCAQLLSMVPAGHNSTGMHGGRCDSAPDPARRPREPLGL